MHQSKNRTKTYDLYSSELRGVFAYTLAVVGWYFDVIYLFILIN